MTSRFQSEAELATGSPTILVCLVNWNGRHHLEYALPSLLATQHSSLEIMVVDNASKDGSVEYVRATFSQVRVVENATNFMWAAGNNVGVRIAMEEGHDWVMLANNDILVDPQWAKIGMRVAQLDRRIGVIGYHVIGKSSRVDVREWRRALGDFPGLAFKDDPAIAGCFMMVRREVFEAVGLFDETYQLYGEENDFVARAIKAGFRAVRCNFPIWHCCEGTARKVPLFTAYMATRNELRFYVKQHHLSLFGMLWWFCYRMFVACDIRRSVDLRDSYKRRMHPTRNIFLNGSLVLRAFWWNLVRLRQTRSAGLADEKRCAAFRAQAQKQHSG
jgi:hypothetical protein